MSLIKCGDSVPPQKVDCNYHQKILLHQVWMEALPESVQLGKNTPPLMGHWALEKIETQFTYRTSVITYNNNL